MKQFILFLLVGCWWTLSFAEQDMKSAASFRIIDQRPDESLTTDQVAVTVHFKGFDWNEFSLNGQMIPTVLTAWNEQEIAVKLNSTLSYSYRLTAGVFTYKAFLAQDFEEVIASNIALKGGMHYTAEVWFQSTEQMYVVDKPVIYGYSDSSFPFRLIVQPKEAFLFTYPAHGEGWEGEVKKNQIVMNGLSYPYLFWEAKQAASEFSIPQLSEVVQQEDLLNCIESRLTQAGLNQQEKTDFITYWLPRLLAYPKVQIEWYQNEQCDQFGSWELTSDGCTVNRLFIVIHTTIPEGIMPVKHAQFLQPMKRNGNYFVEWGGTLIQ